MDIGTIRPPLLIRVHGGPWVVHAAARSSASLGIPHVGVRRWIDPPAGSAVDVPVHVPSRSFSDVLQALIFGRMGMRRLV
jgi:hypothetical protein